MKKIKTILSISKAKRLIRWHFKINAQQRKSYLQVPDEYYDMVIELLRRKEGDLIQPEINELFANGMLDEIMGWNN